MFGRPHHFSTLVLTLVLIFGIMLLIVSLSIIDQNKDYDDLYRPELGLAAFNIVISSLAIIFSAAGICVSLVKNPMLVKAITIIMVIIGIFALASLITALIINALSAGYLRTRFNKKLLIYSNDTKARNIIDTIQSDCQCCGFNNWIDYSIDQTDTGSTKTTSLTTIPSVISTSTTTATTSLSTNTPATSLTASSSTSSTSQILSTISPSTTTTSGTPEPTTVPITSSTTTTTSGTPEPTTVPTTSSTTTTTSGTPEPTTVPTTSSTTTTTSVTPEPTTVPITSSTTTTSGTPEPTPAPTTASSSTTTSGTPEPTPVPTTSSTTTTTSGTPEPTPAPTTASSSTTTSSTPEPTPAPTTASSSTTTSGTPVPTAPPTTGKPSATTGGTLSPTAPLARSILSASSKTEAPELIPTGFTTNSFALSKDEIETIESFDNEPILTTAPLSRREITVRTILECTKDTDDFIDRWILTKSDSRQGRALLPHNTSMIAQSINRQFSVPSSCCVNQLSIAACSAVTNGDTNQFYMKGCSTCVIARANKHNMGIAILNSFLMTLSLLVVPVLLNLTMRYESTEDIDAVFDRDRYGFTNQMDPQASPSIICTRH